MKPHPDLISPGQLGCLLFSFLSGFSTLFLMEAKMVKQDVWVSYLLGIALSGGMLWLLCYVQRRHPHLSMFEVFDRLLGRWAAKLLLAVYLVYILEIQAAAMQALTTFYNTVVLPNTSPDHILLLIVLSTTYAAYLGLGTIVRTVQVTMPFFIVAIVIISLFILKNVDSNPFLPMFRHRLPEMAYGGLLSFYFPFGKSVVFCFLLSHVTRKERLYAGSMTAVVLSGVYLCAATYLTFGSLGMQLSTDASFPFFSAIQLVKFGEYLERIEIMIIGIWTMFTLFEVIVLQYVFTKIVGHLFGLNKTQAFIFPVGLFFFVIAQKSFPNINDLTLYNLTIAPFSTLIPMTAIPLLLASLTYFTKRGIPR